MKPKSKLSKFVSVFTAAIMCFVMLPKVSTSVSAANVGDKLSVSSNGQSQQKGNCDGYSYEVWIDNTGGSGSMTLGKGAAFKAEWSASVSRGNFLARRGLDFGSQKKATDYPYIGMDYEAKYSQTGNGGNSRLCVYGWFENRNAAGNPPLVEYYIIEDWVNWRPTANGASKTVTIDGGQYEIFAIDHTGPTIHGNTETFKQYFSVRKDTRTSGHITVSDHFKAWADQGWGIGNLYEVALNAEGWESSGVADVTKLDVYTDPNNRDPNVGPVTPPTPTVEPDKDGNYFYDTFESGAGDWSGRGDASVTTDSKNYYAGSKSLAVTGRTDNWHGAAISLDSGAFVPGNTYSFSTGVLQKSGSATEMKLTLQYTLNGEDNYDEVASATAKSGEWTKLENTSFTIPSGATNMILYVEAPDSLTDFYIDEAKGSKEGVKSSVVNGGGTVDSTSTPVTPVTPSIPTGDSLKGKFGSLFRMGTSVSPNELSSGKDFILKHFNSITPENELKPDALLQQQASIQGGDNNHAVISLDRAAQTLKFCEDNGLGLRGHTFVWYSQTPDWFFKEGFQSNGAYVSKDTMNKRLENFIKDTFAALKSQYPKLDVYSYDVCNELFVNDGGGLRPGSNSGWTRVYGDTNDEFIINAFTYARKYAPSTCKLYINDYNEYIPAKTNDIYNIAMKLKELNVIDGIGMQSHLATNYPDAKTYKAGLEKFLSTGLEVQITELDIETKGNADARAKLFKEVFQMAVDHADQIPAFTVWGTHDSISWRSSETPLLFTSGYQPKPDYDAVMSINVPTSSVVTTTAANPVVTTTTTANPNTDLKVTLWGDANNNGKLEIADAVLIMQAVANADGYGVGGTNKDCLTPQGKVNADCYQPGSDLTSMDALAVQKALVNLVKLPEGDSINVNVTTAATTNAINPPANANFFNNTFSSSTDGWEERGSVSLSLDSNTYYSAGNSLKVAGRSETWHGAQMPLDSSFKAGSAYSFSAAVMQASGSDLDAKMTLQYTLDGEEKYASIDLQTAKNKEWTKLENTAFTIPSGAVNPVLYVELPDSTADFYIDDIQVAEKGTASKVVTGKGTVGNIPDAPVVTPGTIDPSKPMIAISFDDGTSQYGKRIVNAIAEQGFHATFFYVGNWINDESEIKLAYSKGMEIANHTTSHPHLTQLSANDVKKEADDCHNKLKNIIGAEPSKLLRLPYLESNATVQGALKDYGLVTCQIDTQDWNGASKNDIVNTVKSAMASGQANGAIVLCHETYESTAAAIEELAPYIKSQGWQIVTVSEMFAAKGKTINGGQIYTNCK